MRWFKIETQISQKLGIPIFSFWNSVTLEIPFNRAVVTNEMTMIVIMIIVLRVIHFNTVTG